jgi:small-conductance mechanosensitive channel
MAAHIKTWQYTFLAVVVVVIGIIGVGLTTHFLDADAKHSALNLQRSHIIAIEVAAFSIIAIELFGKALVQRTQGAYMAHIGMSVRAVFRVVAYLILCISLVSLLSTSATLAIGVGSFTGLVIAFATQNLIGNVIAGMFIAISRPFYIGDEITVMGSTGRVEEIGTMFTVIDAEDKWIRVPNMVLLTTLIQQKKDKKQD